jgi:hypothetical protein
MKKATRVTLHEAYHLIKAGDKDAARALIKPVLAADRNNSDAWWLAVHAAATPHDRRLALVQVLRLNPDHGPARMLLDRLNAENPQEVEELAKDLPLPPPGQKHHDTVTESRQRRWVWKVMLVFGCLSFSFASTALVTGLLGVQWFDKTVQNIGKAVGVERHQGAGGQLGTVKGGDPNHPYDIPVTEKKGAPLDASKPIVGALNRDEAHIYTFSARRGQEIVALLQFTVAGDAHFVMELWDADQRKLADGVGDYNSGTVTLVYDVIRTEQYALVIIGRPNGPRGTYALGLDVLD